MTVKQGFRPAMTWLHSWAGVILGTLLFTIWWMGTLSVFDKEIDRWMQPETRLPTVIQQLNIDEVIAKVFDSHPDEQPKSMIIWLPRERQPYFQVYAEFQNSQRINDRLHPVTGRSLGESKSDAGSGFIYTMHYRLLLPSGWGYYIVALCTLFMMVLLVTGVVIHRKIFADFFTFRLKTKLRRSSLDLHNITGVVFLPFHFLISLSGLAIFAGFYMSLPFTLSNAFTEDQTVKLFHASSNYGYYSRAPAEEDANSIKVSPLIDRAEAIWTERYNQPAKADRIDIKHYGNANAYIEVRRHFPGNRTEGHRDSINFDGVTGDILMDFEASPIRQVRTWLEGFHQIQFDHWTVRWLYFIAGLAGCILIATGFIFWTAARSKEGVPKAFNVRFVDAICIGSVTGIVIATGTFLAVNRLLSAGVMTGSDPAGIEIQGFFLAWVLAFVHACLRGDKAWAEQAWAIAGICILAVLLNWGTTGDHIIASFQKNVVSVAMMDMVLLVFALLASLSAMKLRRRVSPNLERGAVR